MNIKIKQLNKDTAITLDIKDTNELQEKEIALVNRVKSQADKQGTKHAKDRTEVTGHGKKPYRQKGTGNARQGSTKSSHHVGGGVAHGPKMDTTKLTLNKKFKSLLLRKVVLSKIDNQAVYFVDVAKDVKENRKAIAELGKSALVYAGENNKDVKALRNLSNVDLIHVSKLSSFNILRSKHILFDIQAKEELLKILNK